MRLCSEGGEGRITHLVLGAERRTLKLLLAVAHGAHLLSPSWLTNSQAAGQWLPTAPFTAQVATFILMAICSSSPRYESPNQMEYCVTSIVPRLLPQVLKNISFMADMYDAFMVASSTQARR